MLCEALINHCSPTLAGLKTANLFSCAANEEQLNREIRDLNKVLVKKGLRLIRVKRKNKPTLVYLYRPDRLMKDLAAPEAGDILRKKGYPCDNLSKCVSCLIRRLAKEEEFPHEVGLFLGYPPTDVKCFMNNSREGVKCVGCWKVYGNVQQAEKTFEQFKSCTAAYQKQMRAGTPIDRLIVQCGNESCSSCVQKSEHTGEKPGLHTISA